jgi:hypothetical protein
MNDKEVIRAIARDKGYHHTNKYYRDYALRHYQRDISPSTTTKALGSLPNRLRHCESNLVKSAQAFLRKVNNDVGLAIYLIGKASRS